MKAGAGITEVGRPIHPFLGFAGAAKVVFQFCVLLCTDFLVARAGPNGAEPQAFEKVMKGEDLHL
jgi:hypothetical protein